MIDEPLVDTADQFGDRQSAPTPPILSLTAYVLMAAGATLMIAAVFGTELVHGQDARFSWGRLGVAGFGLAVLLAGLAWFLDPPSSDRAD